MSQSGFTPIQLYRSATPGAVPLAGNLAPGELAINTADQKLFFENASGTVVASVPFNTTGILGVANGGTGATTLPADYILKGNGTSAVSSSVLYENGGYIGIGTIGPGFLIDAQQTLNGLGGISYSNLSTGASSAGFISAGAGNSYFTLKVTRATGIVQFIGINATTLNQDFNTQVFRSTGGSEYMRITSAGSVGIGTSTPTATLEVAQATTATPAIQVTATSGANPSIAITDSLGSAAIAGGGGTLYLRSGGTGAANNRVYIVSSGNVGIGAANPLQKLTVGAGNIFLDNTYSLMWGGTANYITGSNASNYLALATSSAERMRIDSSGNVGVGTIAPSNRLNVVGANEFALGFTAQTSSAQTALLNHPVAALYNSNVTVGNGLNLRYQIADTGGVARTAGGVGMISTAKDASSVTADMYFYTGATEKMRILSGGNVGIGTAAPGVTLDVAGTIRSVRNNAEVRITTSTGYGWRTGTTSTASTLGYMFFQGTTDNFTASFIDGMAISSTGNVGIGTTAPTSKLEVSSTSAGATAEILRLNNPGGGANTAAQIKFFAAGANYASVTGGYGAAAPQMTFNLPAGAGNYVWQNASVEQMRLDASGNLGIGTSAPSYKLEVSASGSNVRVLTPIGNAELSVQSAASGAAVLELKTAAGLNSIVGGIGGTSNLAFSTASTEHMRITSAGDVGIGTSAPAGKLAINTVNTALVTSGTGVGSILPDVFITRVSSGTAIQSGPNVTFADGTSNNNLTIQNSQGNLTFWNISTGTWAERMRLDASGNLLVGATANPGVLNKSIVVNSGAASLAGIVLQNNATGTGSTDGSHITIAATDLIISNAENAPIFFKTNGTERMRITAVGNIGIGTSAPSAQLAVTPPSNPTSATGGLQTAIGEASDNAAYQMRMGYIYDTVAGTYKGVVNAIANSLGADLLLNPSGGNVGIGTSAPAYRLQLSTDSAAKPSTNTWTIASDSRIKTETGEYTKGLNAVCALRPITYHYNGTAGFAVDGKENISIIAQEAMQHFPECVGTFEALLNEGDEEKTELFNWNGHALTFALVNAVKELKATNDALTARVAQLEGK